MRVVDVPPWLLRPFAVVLGLFLGSFLNVVIVRVPRDESIAWPGSHCRCGRPLSPWENIPVVSWLALRGKARCCGARISPRYPIVELIGGLVALALLETEVIAAAPDAPLGPLLAMAGVDLALALALIGAAFIDLEHMYLPDPITLGGTVVALLTVGLRHSRLSWQDAIVSAVLGFVLIWAPFIVGWKWLRGRPGMGLGDAKLLALIGAWQGWKGVLFALFAGSVQGTVAALVTYVVRGRIDEPEAVRLEREQAEAEGDPLDPEVDPVALPPDEGLGGARVAFGPFLVLAALEFLVFGQVIVERYASWIESGS